MKEKAEMDSKGLKVYFDKYERCIVGFHSSLSVSIPQVEVYHHCLVVGIIVCQQTPFDKSVRLILMMLRVCVCVTFFCSRANRLVTIIYVVGHSHESCDAHCLIYIGTFLGRAFF